MRQKDDGSALKDAGKRIVKHRLGVIVEDGDRFLDDQDGGIAEDGPRERDAKTLAGRERMAQVTYRCLIAAGQALNEIVSVRDFGRFNDLEKVKRRFPAANVVGHRVVK